MDNRYFPSMAQQRRCFKEREKKKWVNGRDILTKNTTDHTPPSGIPITDDIMDYSYFDSLHIPYLESEGYNSVYHPSYLTPEGNHLPPEGEAAPRRPSQGTEKQYTHDEF